MSYISLSENMAFIVERITLYGSSSIGVFIFANNDVAIVPVDTPLKVEKTIEEILNVRIIKASIMNSVLIGVLMTGNSHGILLPKHTLEKEIDIIKQGLGDINIGILPCKKNAIGNIVLANDKAAIMDPEIDKRIMRIIQDILDVEVTPMRIAGHSLVGAVATVTNNGMMVHPLATEDEIKYLMELFKVKVDVGTVNRGSPFIRSGLVVNDKGALVGFDTTGPEIMRIHQIFSS